MYKEAMARARQNREAVALLMEKGWISTGDVPYRFSRVLCRSSGTIGSHLSRILERLLEALGDEYRSAHVRRIGCRRFISPDCTRRLLHYVIKHGPIPRIVVH